MASLDGIRTHLGENDPRWKPSGGKRGGPASALPCITRARYRIFKRFIASRAVLWQIIPASEKAAGTVRGPHAAAHARAAVCANKFIFTQCFPISIADYIRERELE